MVVCARMAYAPGCKRNCQLSNCRREMLLPGETSLKLRPQLPAKPQPHCSCADSAPGTSTAKSSQSNLARSGDLKSSQIGSLPLLLTVSATNTGSPAR